MTDNRDPLLQNLFDEANSDMNGEEFTNLVMAQTRTLNYRLGAGLISIVLLLATSAWFLSIPLEVAQLVTQLLTTSLIDLGNSWAAWILSPINNIASLLIISVKLLRVVRKKIRAVSYAN